MVAAFALADLTVQLGETANDLGAVLSDGCGPAIRRSNREIELAMQFAKVGEGTVVHEVVELGQADVVLDAELGAVGVERDRFRCD